MKIGGIDVSKLNSDELADINNKFFRSTNFDNFDEYCKISNSVWLNNRFIFEVPLLERLAEKYYAVSFEKDFKDETVPAQISDWIYKNTSGNNKLDSYVNSIDQVERITRFDFFPELPDEIEKEIESQYDLNNWK